MNKFIYFFIILFFNGLINFVSTKYGLPLLKLWKELFIFLIFILEVYYLIISKKNQEKKVLSLFFIIFVIYILHSHYEGSNYLYQMKLDFIFLYFLGVYLYINRISQKELISLYKILLRIFFYLGSLNCLVGFFQTKFPKVFLKIVGLSYGNWGSSVGIKIITAAGRIRAPGLLTTFNSLGTISLIGFILSIEYNKKILSMIFLLGIYSANYKTSYFGLVLYVAIKLINRFCKIKKYTIPFLLSIFSLVVGFILMNYYKFYDIFLIFGEKIAYNSIYLRIFYHKKIISDLMGINYILGQGLGKNGSYSTFIQGIPLDSTYIYMLSNYGVIMLLACILYILFLQKNLYKIKNKVSVMKYYITIFVVATFYQNVEVSNFPANIIILTFVIIQNKIIKNRKNLRSKCHMVLE